MPPPSRAPFEDLHDHKSPVPDLAVGFPPHVAQLDRRQQVVADDQIGFRSLRQDFQLVRLAGAQQKRGIGAVFFLRRHGNDLYVEIRQQQTQFFQEQFQIIAQRQFQTGNHRAAVRRRMIFEIRRQRRQPMLSFSIRSSSL